MCAHKVRLAITVCGFGLMLSLNAFTLWGISALLDSSGTWPQAVRELTAWCLPANVGTFFIYGIAAARFTKLSTRRPTTAACAFLAAGALGLLGACGNVALQPALLALAGICLGSGGALAFICWEFAFAATPTDDARKAILMASVFSALPYCVLAFAPHTVMIVALTAGLIPACIALLLLGRRHIPLAEGSDGPAASDWHGLWSSLLVPLACTMMVGLVGPALGSFATLEPMNTTLRTLLYQFANLLSVGVLALCWFKLKVRPTLESAFLALVPIAVVALFLFPFWSHGYQGVVLAFGCFIFSFISILMMMLSIELSQRYGVGLGAVLRDLCRRHLFGADLRGFVGPGGRLQRLSQAVSGCRRRDAAALGALGHSAPDHVAWPFKKARKFPRGPREGRIPGRYAHRPLRGPRPHPQPHAARTRSA